MAFSLDDVGGQALSFIPCAPSPELRCHRRTLISSTEMRVATVLVVRAPLRRSVAGFPFRVVVLELPNKVGIWGNCRVFLVLSFQVFMCHCLLLMGLCNAQKVHSLYIQNGSPANFRQKLCDESACRS